MPGAAERWCAGHSSAPADELLGPVISRFSEDILIHRRYIDDGFLIWTGSLNRLRSLLTALGSTNAAVRITTAYSLTRAIFLDLLLTKDDTGELETDVFQKAMNKYLYPLWRSEIPRTTLAGIAIGEIIRYIKRCSRHESFLRMVKLLTTRLHARGWPHPFIWEAYQRAPYYSARDDLLLRTIKLRQDSSVSDLGDALDVSLDADVPRQRTTALILDYSAAANRLRPDLLLRRHLHLLPAHLRSTKIIVAWRAPQKIGDLIRYRLKDEIATIDDTTTGTATPPAPASVPADEECGESDDGNGGVFLQDASRFRLSQLAPGDGSAFGSNFSGAASDDSDSPHDTLGCR